MSRSRSFHWCFTLNNYSEDEYEKIIQVCESSCKYWIIGKEIGDAGTPHLQGYASFRRRRDLNVVRREFGGRAHLEIARGSSRQNREYCSKGGNYREGGEFVESSNSSKLTRDELGTKFSESFKRGLDGIHDFSGEHAGTWFFSGHNLLRNALTLERPVHRPDIYVEWIWGEPGVGKSRYAHQKYENAFIKDPRTKWWSGYMLEKEVIIDDFGPNGIDINHLLRWFDRYKCYVETKGGMVPLLADKFIVTSNFEPEACFLDKEGVPHPQMSALYRRIQVTHME